MLSDHDLWCFALSAKVGWVGCISECGAQMVWKEPKVRRHHLQTTFIQGWVGGPVMIAFDFHEMSWLELPVKSLGQKGFCWHWKLCGIDFLVFHVSCQDGILLWPFWTQGFDNFRFQQSFSFVYADSLASAVGVVPALLPWVAS